MQSRKMLCLLLALVAGFGCLLQVGCVTPSANAAGGITDRITEKAVDYAKEKYVDPMAADVIDALKKHFPNKVTGAEIDRVLTEAKTIAKAESTPSDAATQTKEHPLDVLIVRVCTLNDKGEKTNCGPSQRVRREDWPTFWRSNQGDWKYPNGVPLKKFETLGVEPFVTPPGGKQSDEPQLPTIVLPASLRTAIPQAVADPATTPVLWSPVGHRCNCGCGCANCNCGGVRAAPSEPQRIYYSPIRQRGGGCGSCG